MRTIRAEGAAWLRGVPATDSYPVPMTANRRRRRSVRATAAVCLLVVAGLLLAPALAFGQRLVLATTAILVWLAGVVAARLLNDEHVTTRREAAYDRAVQARSYADTFTTLAVEHDQFAATMTGRIAARDADLIALESELEAVRVRVAEAETRAGDEAARAEALQSAVTRLEARAAELSDDLDEQKTLASESLAFWYGRHDPSVEDLLDWEERSSSRPQEPLRRQA